MSKEQNCSACVWGDMILGSWSVSYVLWVLVSLAILPGNIAGEEWVSVGACLMLLAFHIVGIPIYSGLINGKLHRHLRLESVVRDDEGKKVLRFDRPVILKYIGGIFRRDRLIGPNVSMYWEVVRTGIGPDAFVLREAYADKHFIKAPLDECLTFWLKRVGVNDQGPLNSALHHIKDMLAGIQVLHERVEESGKVRPRHQCAIALPIKQALLEIKLTPSGETKRLLNMVPAATASRLESWRDRIPPLVTPKAPAPKVPGNSLEQN